jgi:hypothetical protein
VPGKSSKLRLRSRRFPFAELKLSAARTFDFAVAVEGLSRQKSMGMFCCKYVERRNDITVSGDRFPGQIALSGGQIMTLLVGSM